MIDDAPAYTLNKDETDALLYLTFILPQLKGELYQRVRSLLRDLYMASNAQRRDLAKYLIREAVYVRKKIVEKQ